MKANLVGTLLAIALLGASGKWSAAAAQEVAAGEFDFFGDAFVLQLEEERTHPTVMVDLADGEQQAFILDTGASVHVIDSGIAEALGYEVIGELEIGAPGGNQVPGKIVRVPLASIGDAMIKNAEFVTMDFNEFSNGQFQGVLGTRLFQEHLLTLDLANGQMTVSRGSLSAGDSNVDTYEDVDSHIRVNVDIAGTRVPSHIDTGSMGGFTFPAELKRSLPLLEPAQRQVTALSLIHI